MGSIVRFLWWLVGTVVVAVAMYYFFAHDIRFSPGSESGEPPVTTDTVEESEPPIDRSVPAEGTGDEAWDFVGTYEGDNLCAYLVTNDGTYGMLTETGDGLWSRFDEGFVAVDDTEATAEYGDRIRVRGTVADDLLIDAATQMCFDAAAGMLLVTEASLGLVAAPSTSTTVGGTTVSTAADGDMLDPTSPEGLGDDSLGGVDMSRACFEQHAGSAVRLGSALNAYSWYCVSPSRPHDTTGEIDVNRACRSQYGGSAYAAFGNFRDAYSWYCVR